MEREKKRQFQREAEIHWLEQIAKKKEKQNQVMSVDFEANHLCSNTVSIANENTKYLAMNYQCDNTKSTRDKSF